MLNKVLGCWSSLISDQHKNICWEPSKGCFIQVLFQMVQWFLRIIKLFLLALFPNHWMTPYSIIIIIFTMLQNVKMSATAWHNLCRTDHMWKEVKYKKSEIIQYVTLHHCRIALKMSKDIIFNIFHYFSGPTAKRDQMYTITSVYV
jgi:hypothetical protein